MYFDSFFKGFKILVSVVGRVRIVLRTGCLFSIGEASEVQGRILVGTKKIRISVYGLLGDKPSYRHSLDHSIGLPWGRGPLPKLLCAQG